MRVLRTITGAMLFVTAACNGNPAYAGDASWRRYVPVPPSRGEMSVVYARVTNAALRHGVPPALAHGVARVESNYRCNAVGGGAIGVMQVLPQTARGVGVHGNLKDCAVGIEAGMRYLRQALTRSGGNWCSAATAYNTGRMGTSRCSGYGLKVMRSAGM